MAVSFGDCEPDEIYNLIENKDPLGLNSDIQGHNTQQIKEYDAIPHYIKMLSTLKMANISNNADSNPESEDNTTTTKDTIPSQVNYPSTSQTRSNNTPYIHN